MNISTLVSTDGTVYLRTHQGQSSQEIAESLRPYIGRILTCDLPNNYGYYHRYRAKLEDVNGTQVQVEAILSTGSRVSVNVDAFDAFGTHCTIIHPE